MEWSSVGTIRVSYPWNPRNPWLIFFPLGKAISGGNSILTENVDKPVEKAVNRLVSGANSFALFALHRFRSACVVLKNAAGDSQKLFYSTDAIFTGDLAVRVEAACIVDGHESETQNQLDIAI